MTTIQDKIHIASTWLVEVVKDYKPIAVFGLFSGGHDSLSATWLASTLPQFTSAVHINTGIGVEETRRFVQRTCRNQNWPLLELKAEENVNSKGQPDPKSYRDFVLKYGFPGPAGHGFMYVNLKERALKRLGRMYGADARGKNKRRIMLVTGVRNQESARRMGNAAEDVDVRGREIWVNPILDWTKSDTSELIEYDRLERSPIVDLIHKSGECLCGAFAKPGELEELKLWPQTREAYDRIKALEAEAKAAGVHCVWGTRPPKKQQERQYKQLELGPLCWSCSKYHG